jgi:hypothetical protein
VLPLQGGRVSHQGLHVVIRIQKLIERELPDGTIPAEEQYLHISNFLIFA